MDASWVWLGINNDDLGTSWALPGDSLGMTWGWLWHYFGKPWQDSGILWHTMAYSVILWPTLAYSDILCYTLLYSVILCYTLLYSVILCYTLLYSVIRAPDGAHKQARVPFHETQNCILDVHTECWKNADLIFSFLISWCTSERKK